MARMFPDRLDPATRSPAESMLYQAFREQLDDAYIVFHHVAWLALDRRKHPRDGEADFVVAHPELGVLVLEVKGGTITRDMSSQRWTSTDLSGQVHTIKNPVEQAMKNKYSLLDQLKPTLHRFVDIGHAVGFPDVLVGEQFLGLDLPREIVLDQTDLPHLARWVRRTMEYWSAHAAEQHPPLGADGIQALISLLGKQWELRPALWEQFAAERQQFIRLTQEQFRLLDSLNRHRRVLILGFAGSGKTLLAVEKATRLARQGFRVLLTCYNRQLAIDLRKRLGLKSRPGHDLDIFNFHDLCMKLAQKAHVRLPEATNTAAFYEQFLPNALLEASKNPAWCYDAILVDEGQDFLESWWLPLQCLLHEPDDGILYIFYDDNQRLYDREQRFPIDQPPFHLTVNCRTTRRIHEQILAFYQGETAPVAHGPEGQPVAFLWYEDRSLLQEAVLAALQRLHREEAIPVKEMVVLTPFSQRTSRLKPQEASAGSVGLDWSPLRDNQVELETIHSFKGLERTVVVLVEIERWFTQGVKAIEIEHLLYVACSRACHYLLILLPKQLPEEVQRLFGKRL